jgi:hypothetical protein
MKVRADTHAAPAGVKATEGDLAMKVRADTHAAPAGVKATEGGPR